MNPLERLRDDFPHGTVEGGREGCTTKDCPAEHMQCWEVLRNYRIDMRFQRAYKAGARGAELLALDSTSAAPAAQAPAAEVAPVAEAAAVEDAPAMTEWQDMSIAEQDAELLARVYAGATNAQLADRIGCNGAAAAGRRVTAARKRATAVAQAGAAGTTAETALQHGSAPVTVAQASTPSAHGVVVVASEIEDISGPQIRTMFVVVDQHKRVVAASTQVEAAVAALGDAWKLQLGAEARA
ncbi:hypothetical protein [Leucobacter salsicius]|uniref:hypothetical protein n=1 Tax=Leucobacter salsicius TaxID=664638 RepID=UPI00034BB5B7|nr:hypothetical protein [Leucobacter salsicius]